mgnify:CR=1 FL=1
MYTSAFASALEFARKPNRGPGAALDKQRGESEHPASAFSTTYAP